MKAVIHTGSKSLSSCQIPPLTSGPRVQLIRDVNTSINSNAIIPAHTSTIDVGAGAISTRSATTVTSTTDSTASNALPLAGNTSIHNNVVPAGRSDATSDVNKLEIWWVYLSPIEKKKVECRHRTGTVYVWS